MSKQRVARNTWPTAVGFERFLRDCESSGRFKPTEAMYELNNWCHTVSGNASKVPICCSICGFDTSVTIRNFHSRKSAGCFCNGKALWNTKQAHERLMRAISETRFEPSSELLSFQWWKSQNPNFQTHLPLKCTLCGVLTPACQAMSFMRDRTAWCLCRHRSRCDVFCYLNEICLARQLILCLEYTVGTKTRSLKVDLAVLRDTRPILLVEVDGDQHFRSNTQFRSAFEQTVSNDLVKEQLAATRGLPLARVYQKTIESATFDWKSFLEELVTKAIADTLETRVYCQPHLVYTSGVYAGVRDGRQMGEFLTATD